MPRRYNALDRLAEYGEELDGQAKNTRRARTMLIVAAPFFAILMFMTVTRGSDREDVGVYDAAVLWADNGPDAYRLSYTITGQPGVLGPATVTVRDGTITSYETSDPALEDGRVYTVEQTFFIIEGVANDPEGDVLAVEFDAELGYAVSVSFDPIRGAIDDEWSLEVVSFEVLAELSVE